MPVLEIKRRRKHLDLQELLHHALERVEVRLGKPSPAQGELQLFKLQALHKERADAVGAHETVHIQSGRPPD
jgi:hypothetical protein